MAADLGIWGKVDRKAIVSEIMEKGFAHYKNVELFARSGRVLPLLWCGDRVRIQNQDCLLVSAYDLTEMKEAQKALKESEKRLELALDSVSDAVWDWRVDTNQVYYSSRWFTMLGVCARTDAGSVRDLGKSASSGGSVPGQGDRFFPISNPAFRLRWKCV